MRAVEDWDESDLHALVAQGVQESLQLDYKRSESLAKTNACRNEISKDVSAFANSAGGRIVYGIEEKGHLPVSVDGGVDTQRISREWLEQTITSTIQPRIQGVLIKQIELANKNAAFVIDIPQARSFAPHQAYDNKYYKRFNFMSVPMEDYEVKDVLRRATSPELFVELKPKLVELQEAGALFRVGVVIRNRSAEPAFYGMVRVLVDKRLTPSNTKDVSIEPDLDLRIERSDGAIPVHTLQRRLAIPGTVPIYKEETFKLGSFDIVVPPASANMACGYLVTCPGFSGRGFGSLERVADELLVTWSED